MNDPDYYKRKAAKAQRARDRETAQNDDRKEAKWTFKFKDGTTTADELLADYAKAMAYKGKVLGYKSDHDAIFGASATESTYQAYRDTYSEYLNIPEKVKRSQAYDAAITKGGDALKAFQDANPGYDATKADEDRKAEATFKDANPTFNAESYGKALIYAHTFGNSAESKARAAELEAGLKTGRKALLDLYQERYHLKYDAAEKFVKQIDAAMGAVDATKPEAIKRLFEAGKKASGHPGDFHDQVLEQERRKAERDALDSDSVAEHVRMLIDVKHMRGGGYFVFNPKEIIVTPEKIKGIGKRFLDSQIKAGVLKLDDPKFGITGASARREEMDALLEVVALEGMTSVTAASTVRAAGWAIVGGGSEALKQAGDAWNAFRSEFPGTEPTVELIDAFKKGAGKAWEKIDSGDILKAGKSLMSEHDFTGRLNDIYGITVRNEGGGQGLSKLSVDNLQALKREGGYVLSDGTKLTDSKSKAGEKANFYDFIKAELELQYKVKHGKDAMRSTDPTVKEIASFLDGRIRQAQVMVNFTGTLNPSNKGMKYLLTTHADSLFGVLAWDDNGPGFTHGIATHMLPRGAGKLQEDVPSRPTPAARKKPGGRADAGDGEPKPFKAASLSLGAVGVEDGDQTALSQEEAAKLMKDFLASKATANRSRA